MGWKAYLVFNDGERLEVDDGRVFENEEDANDAALYDLSCYHEGGEIMEMMGDQEEELYESQKAGEPEIEIDEVS